MQFNDCSDRIIPIVLSYEQTIILRKRTVMRPECRVDMVCKQYAQNKDGMAFKCYNKECNGQACPWEWDSHGNHPMGWDGMGQHIFVFPMGE